MMNHHFLRHRATLFGLIFCFIIWPCYGSSQNVMNNIHVIGDSQTKVTQILNDIVIPARKTKQDNAVIINKVSAALLNTPYVADTLIGSKNTPEKLLIDLDGIDCFTFLDNVLALSQAINYQDFIEKLTKIRYINGKVDYTQRRHFFSDWVKNTPYNATDITSKVSPKSVTVIKNLNEKAHGQVFLDGIPVQKRSITFIPAANIDENVVNHLKTGDLIGIYTPQQGLDVTHVGIFIMTPQGPMFRNASSLKKNRKVVDSPFLDYVKNTPGILVYEPIILTDSVYGKDS